MPIQISKPTMGKNECNAVIKVLRSRNLAQGKMVEKFENNFAKYVGVKYAVATNSGTAALHAALASLDLKPGDEVVTTPFSFVASANAILYCSAKPVFADIDATDYNINPESIEKVITKKTRAILVVHLYGQPAQMDKILKIAKKHNLYLIEDACQAHGAKYRNIKVGGLGDMGCFSFYPTKNMTTGEGGIVTTNNEAFYNKLKKFRNHGQKARYYQDSLGYNYRMTEINAAIGIEQLRKLDIFNKKRQENAKYLISKLNSLPGIAVPKIFPERFCVFHQFTIRILSGSKLSREKVQKMLEKSGVSYGIYYPVIIPAQDYYQKLGYTKNSPVSEMLSNEVLSIPVGPHLTKTDLKIIINVFKDASK